MRRAAKIDRNQPEIVSALRRLGASVYPAHAVGGGFPDLVVGFRGVTHLVEVKDGALSPSRRVLTPAQKLWHEAWRGGRVVVVESVDDALRLIETGGAV